MMSEFKDSKTLYEEQKAKGKVSRWERPLPEAGAPGPSRRGVKRPADVTIRKCEYFTSEGCGPSREAFELGLAKAIFPCSGFIPPVCTIRQRLIAGVTIQEICAK